MIREMEKNKELCGSDILKKIPILDAIYWVAKSWEVEKSTIVKCFRKSGFDERIFSGNGNDIDLADQDEDDDNNIPLILVKLSRELYGCAFQESHNLDSALKTSDEQTLDWDLPANELIRVRPETDDEDEEEIVDASNENEPVCICIPEAKLMVQKLRQFAIKMGRTLLLNKVMDIDDELLEMMTVETKQTTISRLF